MDRVTDMDFGMMSRKVCGSWWCKVQES